MATGHLKSECCEIKMGTPQGSVLGPLLFSLYISEISERCNEVGLQMFADGAESANGLIFC